MRKVRCASILAASLLLPGLAGAQIRNGDGHFITAHSYYSHLSGIGGLWVHHPRQPGSTWQIKKVPAELTGINATTWFQGATSVLWTGEKEPLLVGEGGAGTQLDLYRVWVKDRAVVKWDKVYLGTAATNIGWVTQIARHPGGGFVVAVDRIVQGPLQGAAVGLVTFSTEPAVRSLFMRPSGDIVVAGIAVDNAANVYVNIRDRMYAWSDLWIVPPPPQGAARARVLTRLQPAVQNLQITSNGQLAAGGLGNVIFVDIVRNPGRVLGTCNVQTGSVQAFALEPATGGFAFATGSGGTVTGRKNAVYFAGNCTAPTLLNTAPASGWGGINGITVSGVLRASYDYIDQKAPYKNPSPPCLTALNTPRVGAVLQLRVVRTHVTWGWSYCGHQGGIWINQSLLLTGTTNPDSVVVPGLGFLFSSAEIVTPVLSGTGFGFTTLRLTVPNDKRLIGVSFYQQVALLTLGPTKSVACGGLSRGGHGVIGR